ncbi:hypothetical protein ScalyP_jg1776 [Parmales sp. scaly parma]|nr:hypothetical protein ScalyP_jg1776 [Parmales sp. scaly parma]
MSHPLLFLDVDGVLNTTMMTMNSTFQLHPKLMRRLLSIVKRTNCQICISSTWRRSNPHLQFLHTKLIECGCPPDCSDLIVGKTPLLIQPGTPSELRVKEIVAYVDEHKLTARMCVIDDLDLDFTSAKHKNINFVRTKEECGVSDEDVENVVECLLRK